MNRPIADVCLALVHNNDAHRYARIQPRLNALRTGLAPKYSTKQFEIAFRSSIKSHNLLMAFLRDAIYQVLDRGWRRYRLIESRLLPLHVASFLVKSLKKYSCGDDAWKRNSFVEMVVTDKHIRAWVTFLETDADFLICFEDDAVFRNDSVKRINELLDTLCVGDFNKPIYIDLAGGCGLPELRIAKLETGRDTQFRYYSKPVTNTACAYLMSRQLVAVFCQLITGRPWLRLIGIDWMMNKLFMLMANSGQECICIHADPTIFVHGTATGEFVSWQAKVPH